MTNVPPRYATLEGSNETWGAPDPWAVLHFAHGYLSAIQAVSGHGAKAAESVTHPSPTAKAKALGLHLRASTSYNERDEAR